MVNLFLDANIIIDIISHRQAFGLSDLGTNHLYISALSIHLATYFSKTNIPDPDLNRLFKFFKIIPLSIKLVDKSLIGPTTDFEDNTQLNSAYQAEADFFITEDKKLLHLKLFGKTQIIKPTELKNLNSASGPEF